MDTKLKECNLCLIIILQTTELTLIYVMAWILNAPQRNMWSPAGHAAGQVEEPLAGGMPGGGRLLRVVPWELQSGLHFQPELYFLIHFDVRKTSHMFPPVQPLCLPHQDKWFPPNHKRKINPSSLLIIGKENVTNIVYTVGLCYQSQLTEPGWYNEGNGLCSLQTLLWNNILNTGEV